MVAFRVVFTPRAEAQLANLYERILSGDEEP